MFYPFYNLNDMSLRILIFTLTKLNFNKIQSEL